MKIFNLPDLGEGLPDAEIHAWYVKEGDEVVLDQPIVAIETAKAIVDVPSPFPGKITKLYGKPGDIIQTGSPLIAYEEETTSNTVAGSLKCSDTILPPSATGITPSYTSTASVKITPALRMLAKQLNIPLEKVQPTGTHGQITAVDIMQAKQQILEQKPATNANQRFAEDLRGARRTMATTMMQSHQQVVPVTLLDDADVHAWPNETDITIRLIRALIKACKQEPALNAWFDGASLTRSLLSEIHLGLAIDTPEGLFVPVIQKAEQYTAEQMRNHINQLKKQISLRSLPPQALTGATISLSNFGNIAGCYANPIVIPPQVAILGVGQLRQRVVAFHGAPAVHMIIPLSLTIDHRAVTGGEAARFLAAVIQDLESEA